MDNLILTQVAADLHETLYGARVVEFRQETAHRFRFVFDMDGRTRTVSVSLQPELPWIGRPPRRWEGPRRPPSRFAVVVARTLRGGILRAVEKPGPDRRVCLTFGDGRGIVAEMATHGANLVLVDRDGVVTAAARSPAAARHRVTEGKGYVPPSLPEGLLVPHHASADEIDRLVERLTEQGETPFETLRRHVFGIGSIAADLILEDAAARGVTVGSVCRDRIERLLAGEFQPVIDAVRDPSEWLEEGRFEPQNCRLLPWDTPYPGDTDRRRFRREGAAATAGLFHEARERSIWLRQRIDGLQTVLRRESRRLQGLEHKISRDLAAFDDPDRYRIGGEAILAGLNVARRAGDHVFVPNPYDVAGTLLEVPAPSRLSLPQAAEALFRRHRRARRGLETARRRREAVVTRGRAIDELRQVAERAATVDESGNLEAEMRDLGLAVGLLHPSRASPALGARARTRLEGVRMFVSSEDVQILVGKSGRDNQRLTFRLASPEDFWFHALGCPGAHVVARNPERSRRPDDATLRQAAALAAWFSDARGHADADVQWTRRKYVRKVRGAPPGTVRLKRFETIRVRPEIPAGQENRGD